MRTPSLRKFDRLKLAVFVGLVVLSLFPRGIRAQERDTLPEEKYTVAFQGISLSEALEQFLIATNGSISIAWDPLLASGKRSFCVISEVSVNDLLTCILNGTGLDYIIRSNGLYVLELATEGPVSYGHLRGIIIDRDTEQPVPNASVVLTEAKRGLSANQQGMFLFPRLLPGIYHMQVRHVGYRPSLVEIQINSGDDVSTEVILESESVLITTPLVIDGFGMQPNSLLLGSADASLEEITANLNSGTNGLLQSLDAMPGVRVNDATSDIHIQGGEAGEHQFRLDGAPVFLPLNVASFIGPFSPFALGNITVNKAGFAARLGSQISGIVSAEHDLRAPASIRGAKNGSQFTIQVDPLSSNGRYSGFWQLPGGRHITALGAARIGTWSLLAPPSLTNLMDNWNTVDTFLLSAFAEGNTPFANLPGSGNPAIQFVDLHGASKIRFGALKTLHLSSYFGKSSLGNNLTNIDPLDQTSSIVSQLARFRDLYSWTNGMAQARFDVVQNAHILTSLRLRGSMYNLSHDFEAPDEFSGTNTEDDGNRVYEVSLDGTVDYFLDNGQEVEIGAELTLTGSRFTVAGTQQFPLFHESSGIRFATYLEDKIQLGSHVVVEGGSRLTWLAARKTLYAEPRIAARMDWLNTPVGDVSMFWATGIYRQFVNQYDISSRSPRTFVSSTRFWMGNDASVTPPKAAHFASEFLIKPNAKWSLGVESFYKHQFHILSVDYSASSTDILSDLKQSEFLKTTSGFSYGIGTKVQRSVGAGSLKARFDHTITKRRIDELFGNRLLSAPWSEPFRLELSADLVPMSGLVVLARWRGSWGRTWGYRKAYYDFLSAHLNDLTALLKEMKENGVSTDAINRIERQVTNYDLTSPDNHILSPIYQLDLSTAYSMRLGKYSLQVRADLINVLNRDNTAEWRFELDEESYFGGGVDNTTGLLERSDRLLLPRVFSAAVRLTW